MAMVVKNNMSAVRTLNTLNSNTSALQKSLQKVSSGMKINSAQDDASGYAISERMRVRIRSLDQANQNSQNDSSLMKTAEGAVGNTVEILRALKEKAINAANDSNTDEDRQTIQKEINQFIDQIDDNALVQFNGKYLVDGSKNNAFFETKSILLNQSLKVGTKSTSALTDLANRAGDSLGIQTSDQYQVSWVQNGTIHFTSGRVEGNSISDILTLKNSAGDQISEVKATDKSGLISGPADLTTEVVKYNSSFVYDASDNTTAQAIIEAFSATNPTDGDTAIDISSLTTTLSSEDGSATETLALFAGSPDGTTALTGTIQLDTNVSTNPNYDANKPLSAYVLTLADQTTVYQLNPKYAPENDTNTYTDASKVYVTAYEAYDAANSKGISVNSLEEPLKSLGTSPKKLSELAIPTLPEGAKNAEWVILDSSNNEVSGYANYTVQANSNGYLYAASGDTTPVALTDGSKIVLKYQEVVPEQESTEENGLSAAWDKFGKEVYTPDKTEGIAFGAWESSVNKQIAGLTINILDQDGNVKKAANAALDQFKQYQRAENKTGDMSLNFHIGSEANVSFKVGMGDMRAQALGLKGSDGTRIDVYTKEHANAAINVIENALTKALDQQTTIGAIEARLEYTSTNLTTSSENVQAAESTIRDADMAKEMTNYTKSNVLLQAAQAMLAQANQNSSAVLSLLQ